MKKDDYIKTFQWMNALRGGVLRDVYALLYQLGQKGDVKVTISYICERLGYSERSVRSSVNELVENGFINVEYSDGKCSSYKILKTEDLEVSKSATKKTSDPCKICSTDPCKICIPNPGKICSTAEFAPLQDLQDTPAKFAGPTPYLLSLDKNLDKNIYPPPPAGARARERLQKWFEESDLKEWVLRLEKTHGIPLDTNTLLNDFFDNDFKVREDCERGERTEVLTHFQHWLPKYIRILKQQTQSQNENATTNHRNGSGISPADFASTFATGFLAGGGKLR